MLQDDSWDLWNSFRLLCEHHSQLSVALDVLYVLKFVLFCFAYSSYYLSHNVEISIFYSLGVRCHHQIRLDDGLGSLSEQP